MSLSSMRKTIDLFFLTKMKFEPSSKTTLLENLYSPPQTDVFSKKKNYINGNVNKCVVFLRFLFGKLCQRLYLCNLVTNILQINLKA